MSPEDIDWSTFTLDEVETIARAAIGELRRRTRSIHEGDCRRHHADGLSSIEALVSWARTQQAVNDNAR